MSQEKHKSQRSESRLLGMNADGSGAPVECRIAFPFHHEKRTKSAGGDLLDKPRHDAVVLVPKLNRDAAQCPNYAALAAHCMEAATKAWQSFPQGGKWPIQDGDIPHTQKPKPGVVPLTPEQIAEKNKWRAGHWVIEVANNLEPGPKVCMLRNGVAEEIPARVVMGTQLYKSGDYGYVYLSAYTFSNKTFGVNYSYDGVLYTRQGELIGSSGTKSATQMFGAVATAAPVPQPYTTTVQVPGQNGGPPHLERATHPSQVPPQPQPQQYAAPPAAPAAPAPQQYAPPAPPTQYAAAPPMPPQAPALPPFPPR